MTATKTEQAIELIRRAGMLRPRDLPPHGIPRSVLQHLLRQGRIQRVGRGLYALPDADPSEHHGLAQVCKLVPHGVVCLLSALRFHDLTTQAPFEVWLAVDVKARKPRIDHPPVRVLRFSGHALHYGVEEHDVEGVTVRVTSPAKTVADCFKYRNKIGVDVAVEALRDYRSTRAGSLDELWQAAEVCRVALVMRPYLEAIL